MNTIRILFTLLFVVTFASCQESHPAKISVQLKDDQGNPITDYKVQASWYDASQSKLKRNEIWSGKFGVSDKSGMVTFEIEENTTGEVGFNLIQGLTDRYYLTTMPNYKFSRVESGRWHPENPVVETVIKRKLKPVPMHARRMGMGQQGDIPEIGREFGFDLEVADWVAPHGKGKNADVYFTMMQRYVGSLDFDGRLRVRFPNNGDGLIAAPLPPNQGSELRLSHQAPTDGYTTAFEFRSSVTPPATIISTNIRNDMNYYMRVRTVLDATGKLKSALYGKIHGDFGFSVTGSRKIVFAYFLNPTPGDRNIEFDPKRNLFTDLLSGEEIYEP